MYTIALFASGSGSNAQRIIEYFREKEYPVRFFIVCNQRDAYVHARANKLDVNAYHISKAQFSAGTEVLDFLREKNTDLIVLAGFLLLVPTLILEAFPQRVINIHPALLPKFGGKGMYGARVHQAVLAAGETESGITIHYCNSQYDEGDIIMQKQCEVFPDDSPDTLVQRIHALEHEWYPKVVESIFLEDQPLYSTS